MTSLPFSEGDPRALSRWSGSFVAVLALHLGVALVVATWAAPTMAPEAPPPAVLIDMVPTPPSPTKPPEVVPEVKPKELPVVEKAEAVIHKPKPKPEPKFEKKKEPEPVRTQETHSAPAAPVRARTPVEARPAPSANYLSILYAHLERHKHYPTSAQRRRQTGTVTLRFAMDRRGNVLSASVAKSSGIAAFDREVLEMVRRAEPLPPPPPEEMSGNSLEFVMPVVFDLKR